MINLFMLLVGFILGLLFRNIIEIIRIKYYRQSKKAKRKAFKKRMDDLMK